MGIDLTVVPLARVREAVASLLLYRSLWSTDLGHRWVRLVQCEDPAQLPSLYGEWFANLAEVGCSWSDWLWATVALHDNPFSRVVSAGIPLTQVPTPLREAAAHDLTQLHICVAAMPLLHQMWRDHGILVLWPEPPGIPDWAESVETLANHYRQHGVGFWGQYRAARWRQGQWQGIAHPDDTTLDDLYGWERQKAALCRNTEALLAGSRALHVLLYGARGTGKSSLVKAILNRYGSQGLRLVEITREDVLALPTLLDSLRSQPHKFVVFIDDLSFEADETLFKPLKVMLEGDMAGLPAHVCLYATSNRRHLIREYFSDRPNPANTEVHAGDTVQEKLSLADRFGLTLTFSPMTQADYFATVIHLAHRHGLTRDPEWLRQQALIWAQQQNGFSGRTARQLITALQAGLIISG
ncbi:MAG: hypothetical protein OHK0012_24920 [Synechococcales cyanobacterium]